MISTEEYYSIVSNSIYGFIFLMALELFISYRNNRKLFDIKDSATSIGLGLGNYIATLLTNSIVLLFFAWLYNYRITELNINPWIYWPLCFLADDLSFYLMHLSSHKIRWFWASHLVHHSSEHFNFTTAIRGPWTGNITGTFIFWAWMPLAGFNPNSIMLMQALSLFYQFALHTETIKKLPAWFEFIFNTPSNHRVHHGIEDKYIDKNFGGTLIIWDKLFKTYQVEDNTPSYGLTQKIESVNPIKIAFYGWTSLFRDIKTSGQFSTKLNYLLKPPGWKENTSNEADQKIK